VSAAGGTAAARVPSGSSMPARRGTAAMLAAGAAVVGVALVGASADGAVAAFFLATLAVLVVKDLEERRLPNRIVLPATAIVLAAQAAIDPGRVTGLFLAGLGAAALLFLPSLARPGSLGMGDVKLALLMGVALGGDVVDALVVAALVAAAAAIWLLVRDGAAARRAYLPFAPFLALGALAAIALDAL
jgi:leader peptidase (prepilin peptidase) / N-methyltransferase